MRRDEISKTGFLITEIHNQLHEFRVLEALSLSTPEYKNRLFVAITMKKYNISHEKALEYFTRFCKWKDFDIASTDKYLRIAYSYNIVAGKKPSLLSSHPATIPIPESLLYQFLTLTEPVFFNPPNNIKDAAIYYHSKGLHPIPAHKNEKRPMVKWKAYQDVQPDIEIIKKWDWTGGIILLATDKYSFLDIDIKSEKHPNGLAFFDKKLLSGRMYERTRNGGYHVFGKGKIESKSVDWCEIKGKGKYILTYPTEGYKL